MKYIIVGFNASGKQQIAEDLRGLGVKVGHIFRSTQTIPSNIYTISDTVYSQEDVMKMFENKSYIFMKENKIATEPFFEGLSFYEYENNDVFIMSPDQFNMVPHFNNDVVFIWLDNNASSRRARYFTERRKYNFNLQETYEKEDVNDFVNRIYHNKVLYFSNEESSRVSAIVYSLIKYPALLDVYKKRFN